MLQIKFLVIHLATMVTRKEIGIATATVRFYNEA